MALVLIHFMICHSKKGHRPRTHAVKSTAKWNRIRVVFSMLDNIRLDMALPAVPLTFYHGVANSDHRTVSASTLGKR